MSKLRTFFITLFFLFFAVGFLFAQTENRLNGKWVTVQEGITLEYRFNNGNFEDLINGISNDKGTYTVSNGNINFNFTHCHGDFYNYFFKELGINISKFDSKWYTVNEIIIAIRPILIGLGLPEKDVNDTINAMMTPNCSVPYSIDGSKLTLTMTKGDQKTVLIYNKK